MPTIHRKVNTSLLLLITVLFSLPAFAQVYKWVDENGKVHYSDRKPPASEKQTVEVVDESSLNNGNNVIDSSNGVDADQLRNVRERREEEREKAQEKRLQAQADAFRSKNCYTKTEEIRRANVGGGMRVVGEEQVKRCRQAIPAQLKSYLSDYTDEESPSDSSSMYP